jgi:transcriptional regulator with XRE-family HTH domain
MNILLEGTVDDVLKWSDRQRTPRISCRMLLKGTSTRVAQDYADVALNIVHRAIEETRGVLPEESAAPYFVVRLHDAAVTAPASAWALVHDNAHHVVALEVAQELRVATATYFGTSVHFLNLPATRDVRRGSGRVPAPIPMRVLMFLRRLVDADLAEEQRDTELVGKLGRLQSGFGLSQVELAELLHVEPQAIRKWLSGGGATPENRAAIDVQLAALRRLESHFKPGLLPSILRRPDRGLEGRRPIELVIKGKSDQFADYVEGVIADDRTA